MNRSFALTPLLAFFLVAPAEDELTWHVAAGSTLTRSFERGSLVELESMEVLVDGAAQDTGPEVEISIEQSLALELVDRIVAVEAGEAVRIERRFEKLSGKRAQTFTPPEGEEQTVEAELASELEGKQVIFVRDGSEWKAKWPEGEEANDALLEGLAAAVDFTGFLPEKAPAEGDSWKVEPGAFTNFIRPGGRLSLCAEGEEPGPFNLREAGLDENMAGEATATYRGLREEDGVKVAVIALHAELTTKFTQEIDAGERGTVTEGIELSYELEGELLWDRAAGCAHSASLQGKLDLEQPHAFKVTGPDGGHDVARTMKFSGKTHYKARFEAASAK